MDYMDDEKMRKSVIDQMMGEMDDVTADSFEKDKGPAKGVEISIIVSPKGEEEMPEGEEEECGIEGCEDPMHNHPKDAEAEGMEEMPESSDYISQLLKKLG